MNAKKSHLLFLTFVSLGLLYSFASNAADMKDYCPETKEIFSGTDFKNVYLKAYNKDHILFIYSERAEGGMNDCCQTYRNFKYDSYLYFSNKLECNYTAEYHSPWEYKGIVKITLTSTAPIVAKLK